MTVANLAFHEENDLVFVDKPQGFSTHSPDTGKWGLAEIYSDFLKMPLFVVHRLDKETTGCLVFAKTKAKAQELLPLFQNHKIKKKYLFLTDRVSNQSQFQVDQALDGQSAETLFTRVKRSPFYELWQAEPKTGRPHQIRKHAALIKLPILGDPTYGGTDFPHLCLHSQEIEIPGCTKWTCPEPRFFQRLGLLRDTELICMLSAVDRRQRLYHFLNQPEISLRLLHDQHPHLKLDLFADTLWAYWYKDKDPNTQDLDRLDCLSSILNKKWLLRKIQNRGKDPNSKNDWSYNSIPTVWYAKESNLTFEFRTDKGLSPGLFLDQRANRKYILENCKDKKVLNLFSYTCGFSVYAAKGQAKEVVSVDVSQEFLDWGKRNFSLNKLNPETYEFYKQDVLLFLKACSKRQRKFDYIICDPPSFARNKDQVFKLEKDFSVLVKLCFDALEDQGVLLLSCNLEKWDFDEFVEKALKSAKLKLIKNAPLCDWDYEEPNKERVMKYAFFNKS